MKPTTVLWILLPLAALSLVAALYVAREAEARAPSNVVWDEDEMAFVRRMVADTYVDELSEPQSRDAFYACIDGYVKSLPDEYNDFLPPDEYKKWSENTAGHYAGVGVRIEARKEGLLLAGVLPGGPAAKAGLRAGEIVTTVDGRSLAESEGSRDANVKLLKGPVGSTVKVTVLAALPADAPAGTARPSREVVVTRDVVSPPTVFTRRLGPGAKVGYLRVTEFVEATAVDFDRELDAMVAAGLKSVIVDLRGNGGGLLPTTVHMADRFISQGEIVRMTGRTKSARRVEMAKAEGTIPDGVGLYVLVDGGSASASEVFSGCIQDYRRGVLLGTRTYGKFLVQNITEIPGRAAAIKLTTARYQTPNGHSYARNPKDRDGPAQGLTPDIVVELSADDKAKFQKSWINFEEETWGATPKYPEVAADWIDPQLQKALDLIAGNLLLQDIRTGTEKKNG